MPLPTLKPRPGSTTRTAPSGSQSASLASLGFEEARAPEPGESYPIMVNLIGREYTIKTGFALTAPGPIALISLDLGSDRALPIARQYGRDVMVARVSLPESSGVKKSAGGANIVEFDSNEALDILEDCKRKYYGALAAPNDQIRTVVVDTGTGLRMLLRVAKLGRLTNVTPVNYMVVNQELEDMVKAGLREAGCTKNVIWIHHMKKQYVKSKDPNKQDSWNGRWEMDGHELINQRADVVLLHENVLTDPANEEQEYSDDFWPIRIRVKKAGPNLGLTGKVYGNGTEEDGPMFANWDYIMGEVFSGS